MPLFLNSPSMLQRKASSAKRKITRGVLLPYFSPAKMAVFIYPMMLPFFPLHHVWRSESKHNRREKRVIFTKKDKSGWWFQLNLSPTHTPSRAVSVISAFDMCERNRRDMKIRGGRNIRGSGGTKRRRRQRQRQHFLLKLSWKNIPFSCNLDVVWDVSEREMWGGGFIKKNISNSPTSLCEYVAFIQSALLNIFVLEKKKRKRKRRKKTETLLTMQEWNLLNSTSHPLIFTVLKRTKKIPADNRLYMLRRRWKSF